MTSFADCQWSAKAWRLCHVPILLSLGRRFAESAGHFFSGDDLTGPHMPHCERCARSLSDVANLLSLRKGSKSTWICFDCVREFSAIVETVEAERRKAAADD